MSDDRTINAKNCTIYVGSVRIVLEPRPNDDDDDDDGKIADGVAETRGRATDEDQDVPVTNTPTKRTNIVSDCGCTKPVGQRQLCAAPYAVQPKTAITSVGPTSQPSDRPRLSAITTSSRSTACCLRGGGRCNHDEWSGAGTDNYCISAGSDDCDAAARNGEPPGRDGRRSPIWGTQNGGRLSPLRFVSRNQSAAGQTLSRIPVPRPSRPEPPVRQDWPVDLYAGSRLPVPIRPGPAPARIPRRDRAFDVRPSPSWDDDRNGRRHTVDDEDPAGGVAIVDSSLSRDTLHDITDDGGGVDSSLDRLRGTDDGGGTDGSLDRLRGTDDGGGTDGSLDRLHGTDDGSVDDSLDSHADDGDIAAVVPEQPSVCVDESAASTSLEQWLPQALDDLSSTCSQPLTVQSDDDDCRGSLEGCTSGDRGSLSDASERNKSVEPCVCRPLPDDLMT